jgi:cytochrome c553
MVIGVLSVVLLLPGVVMAQAPAKGGGPAQGATAEAPHQVHATLLQVMRAIFFVNSNVVFAAQAEDPATMEPDELESSSPSALRGLYGKWLAVENSAIILAEAANLLTIPGRRCANGRPVPVQNADWNKWVQVMRDAGMAAYKAAQSKNQDAIIEVSETLVQACANCHEKYRDWPDMKEEMVNRCRP